MKPHELEQLMIDVLDGSATPEQDQALAETLLHSPAALEMYCRYATMDSAMQLLAAKQSWWDVMTDQPIEPYSRPSDVPLSRAKYASMLDTGRQIFGMPVTGERGQEMPFPYPAETPNRPLRQRRVARHGALAAAVALVLGISFLLVNRLRPPVELSAAPGSVFSCEHPNGKAPNHQATCLRTGEVLRVEQGRVELAFRTGVRGVVEAPARITLESPDKLVIQQGSTWFRVPENARGFHVLSRSLDVIDLGTEFAVLSQPWRVNQLHVLAGRVASRHRGTPVGGPMEEFTAGQAVEAGERMKLVPIEINPHAFATELLTSREVVLANGETLGLDRHAALAKQVVLAKGTARFKPNEGFATIDGRITGPGGFVIVGNNVSSGVALSNPNNDFHGNVIIEGTGEDYSFGGCTLQLNTTEVIPDTAQVFNHSLPGMGGLQFGLAATHETIAGLNGTGDVVANGLPFVLRIGYHDDDSSYVGSLRDGGGLGTLALEKIGEGTLTLSGPNHYTGGTTVDGGTLVLAYNNGGGEGNDSIGTIGGTLTINPGATVVTATVNALGWKDPNWVKTININGGTLNTAVKGDNGWGVTFNMTGGILGSTISGGYFSTGEGNVLNSTIFNIHAASVPSIIRANLTMRQNSPNFVIFNVERGSGATDLDIIGNILAQANGGITKNGAGIMQLNGSNTYIGATLVHDGTLLVNGTTGNGSVTVEANSTLGGNGMIGGAVTINAGGTLAPGGSGTGTLQIHNSLTLSGNAAFRIHKARPARDPGKVSGLTSVNYGGKLTVTTSGEPLERGDRFTLFQANSYSGNFTSFDLPALPDGLKWDISELSANGTIRVADVIRAVTPPTSAPPHHP